MNNKIKLSSSGYYYTQINRKYYHLGKDLKTAEAKLQILSYQSSNKDCSSINYAISEYYAEIKSQYSNLELKAIGAVLTEFAKVFGNMNFISFSALDLEEWQKGMADNMLSRTTIKRKLGYIKKFFKWSAKHKLCEVTKWQEMLTVENLRRGRSKAKEPEKVYPVEEYVFRKTIEFCEPMIRDIALLQYYGAMRPMEVLTIKPDNIERSGDVWVYLPEHHKTQNHGISRRIYLGDKSQDILIKYLSNVGDGEYVFNPKTAYHLKFPKRKIPSTLHERYETSGYYRAITKAAAKAGVAHWFPYQIRHAAATEIRKIAGLEGVQIMLGHATKAMSEVYAEPNSQLGIDIARKFG